MIYKWCWCGKWFLLCDINTDVSGPLKSTTILFGSPSLSIILCDNRFVKKKKKKNSTLNIVVLGAFNGNAGCCCMRVLIHSQPRFFKSRRFIYFFHILLQTWGQGCLKTFWVLRVCECGFGIQEHDHSLERQLLKAFLWRH